MFVPNIEDRILSVVKKNDKVPIYKIAQATSMSIATASKYCHILAAENKIKIENFGNMKLVSKK